MRFIVPFLALAGMAGALAQEIETPIDPNPGTGKFSPGLGGPAEADFIDAGIAGFVGAAGEGVAATATNGNYVNPVFLGWATGVVSYTPSDVVGIYGQNGIGSQFADSTLALGPVTGNNMDIVSLGDMNSAELAAYSANPNGEGVVKPGELILSFREAIRNGEGADFAAFENGFVSNYNTGAGSVAGMMFAELGFVEVSTDGINWARFPSIYNNYPNAILEGRTDSSIDLEGTGTKQSTAYLTQDVSNIYNLVGKHANAYATSYGTPFDLEDLVDNELVLAGLVDLNNIRFVKIVDIPGDGSFTDSQGNPIFDAWVTWGSGGLDFEALGVINYAGITLGSGWDNAANFDARAFVDANTTLASDVTVGALQFNGGHRLDGASVTLGEDNRGIAVVGESSVATLASDLAGEDGLTKSGAGTLIFEGAKSYTGETIVQSGTLKGLVPALTRDITTQTGGTVELVTDGQETFANVISGSGKLRVSGDEEGVLTLGSAQTYTGATEVKNGTLRYGLADAISSASQITVESGAALDLGGYSSRLHSLEGAGQALLGGATLTFVTPSGTTASFSGRISGLGNLVMDGPGTQSLGGASTFTGGVQLKQGILGINSDAALGDASNAIQFSGGTLQIDGTNMDRTDRTLNVDDGGELRLKVADASHTFQLDNGLSGNLSLRVYGPGTTWLSGTNTYTGATTVESGTLKGAVATLSRDIANKGTVELVTGTSDTFSNVISGTGGLRVSGGADSVLTLAAAQTYTGKTTVQDGTLRLGAANLIADASAVVVAAGARFDLNNKAETIKTLEGAGEVALGGATLTLKPSAASNLTSGAGVFDGSITGTGNLIVSTTSTNASYAQVFSGVSTFKGGVTLESGATLGITSNAALGDAANVVSFNGGTLRIEGTDMHSIDRAFTVASGGELKLSVANAANYFDLSQNFSGNYTLGLYGSGVFTLSGTNTQTGGIKLAGGILEIGSESQLGSGPLAFSGGRLRIVGTEISTLTHAVTGTGNIILDIADANHVYTAGTEAVGANATRALQKYGAGTLVYAAGTTRTGNSQVYEGTLDVRAASALNGTGTLGVYNDSSLILRDGVTTAKTVAATVTARILMEGNASTTGSFTLGDSSTATLRNTAKLTGTKTLNAHSAMTLENYASLTGATTLNAQSTLRLQDNATLGGTVTLNNESLLRLEGQSSSSAAITLKNAGTILLESGASLGGSLAIQGGTLGGTGTVRANATFVKGSFLSPGQSVGTLDFENVTLTLETGATYRFEIDAGGSDLVRGIGANDSLILQAGVILNIVSLDGTNPFDGGWTLFSGFETITGIGFLDQWTILYNGQAVSAEFSQQDGGISFQAQAVPEPSTVLLVLVGVVWLWLFRGARRRRVVL